MKAVRCRTLRFPSSNNRISFSSTPRWRRALLLGLAFILLLSATLLAGGGSRMSGTIRDPSGAEITGARVTVMNVETGSTRSTTTDNSGAYTFADLAVGHYDISMECPGFRPYRRTGVALYVNSSLLIDARLEVGREPQTVEVEEGAVHVETSDTQLGEVTTGKKMTTVPLDGRSYTDLLALHCSA